MICVNSMQISVYYNPQISSILNLSREPKRPEDKKAPSCCKRVCGIRRLAWEACTYDLETKRHIVLSLIIRFLILVYLKFQQISRDDILYVCFRYICFCYELVSPKDYIQYVIMLREKISSMVGQQMKHCLILSVSFSSKLNHWLNVSSLQLMRAKNKATITAGPTKIGVHFLGNKAVLTKNCIKLSSVVPALRNVGWIKKRSTDSTCL